LQFADREYQGSKDWDYGWDPKGLKIVNHGIVIQLIVNHGMVKQSELWDYNIYSRFYYDIIHVCVCATTNNLNNWKKSYNCEWRRKTWNRVVCFCTALHSSMIEQLVKFSFGEKGCLQKRRKEEHKTN